MTITSAVRSDAGHKNFAVGAFKDTGTVKKTIVNLGFVPRYVKLVDVTNGTSYEWFAGMADDSAVKVASNGDRTLVTSNGITVGEIDSGATASLWTVYNPTYQTVGTPAVVPTEQTDTSTLNTAGQKFYGFSVTATVAVSSGQFYFTANE